MAPVTTAAAISTVVFTTLLTGGSYQGTRYTTNVVNWVKQLQCLGKTVM